MDAGVTLMVAYKCRMESIPADKKTQSHTAVQEGSEEDLVPDGCSWEDRTSPISCDRASSLTSANWIEAK